MPKSTNIQSILILAVATFCGVGVFAVTNDESVSLQARVDAIISECGYAGHVTFKATGTNEVGMVMDMEAFKKDGPEGEATSAAFSCVTQKLNEIPNLSVGFYGNEVEK